MSTKLDSLIDRSFFYIFRVLLTTMAVFLFLQAIVSAISQYLGEPGFIAILLLASICAYLYLERGRPRRSRSNLVFERQRLDPAELAVIDDSEGEES